MKQLVLKTAAQAKRVIVVVSGFTILIVGVAMIVLPGPAFVVIPIGLAILATEFIWARTLLDTVKERIKRMRKRRFMIHWLRDHHRSEIRERQFPAEWEAIVRANVVHFQMLEDAERTELCAMVQVFLEEKNWEGCGGLELTDEIRVFTTSLTPSIVRTRQSV
jgi:uncharacterized protein (TIGR02611 family)